ncbi:MAG: GNAT family N-acetyltransferase [Candidatus Paceibacterota bacterium]
MEYTRIKQKNIRARGIKFFIKNGRKEIARAYLYILQNDLREEPFGLMEDVFVNKSFRERGIGTKLIQKVIKAAKKNGCYKLISTSRHSRPEVHKLYKRLGFKNHGIEFRMDLSD